MACDRFLIAPYKSGLVKNLCPWLSPQDSFQRLENVNIHRGRFTKRFGGKLIGDDMKSSRVRVLVAATDGNGDVNPAVKVPGTIFKVGQLFTIEDTIFTVCMAGAPANMLSTSAATGTYDTTNGNFTIAGAGHVKNVYWYPAEPIMGITHYELGAVNDHITYVMDTQFVYLYDGTSWVKDALCTHAFHSDNKQFFWAANYMGAGAGQIAMFITNFNINDPMYYYNGAAWADFSAVTVFNTAGHTVQTAKIILAWKNRLILLKTIEQGTEHVNRVRYSHSGSPLSNNAWLERRATFGGVKGDGGGYIDLPTEQEIISAALVKDRLIVYCERSTWELAYTGNASAPFIWRCIDTSVGSESTYSTINFENESVTIATTGIYSCNTANVTRIDTQIPDEVFSFLKAEEGTGRVHGVRDFYNGLAYWTILEFGAEETHVYPNKVIVYNYKESSWSFCDDTITTFGYFEQSTDRTWAASGKWDTTNSWGSYYQQADSRFIIAGNHQGYLFIVDNKHPENAPVMSIANIVFNPGVATLTVPSHNLADDEYIMFKDENVDYDCQGIFKVTVNNTDTITISDRNFTGIYIGGGTVTRVSRILMQSNDWNPYIKDGGNMLLSRMDFCVTNTHDGEVTVDYNVDTSGLSFIEQTYGAGLDRNRNLLEMFGYDTIPLEQYQKTLWRTVYFCGSGFSVNITISHTDLQMENPDISLSPFELQGMILYAMRGDR